MDDLNNSSIMMLNISEKINQLYTELALAEICFEMYKNLSLNSSEIGSPSFSKFLTQFPNLILAERAILSGMLFNQCYKLLAAHPKALSIQRFLERCKNSSDYEKHKNNFQNLLDRYRKPLGKLRNKIYAHTDSFESPDKIFKSISPTISYTDLKNLLSDIRKIINFIHGFLNLNKKNMKLDYKKVGKEQIDLINSAVPDKNDQ